MRMPGDSSVLVVEAKLKFDPVAHAEYTELLHMLCVAALFAF